MANEKSWKALGCTSLTTLGVSSWCILSYKTVGYRHYNYCFHFLNLLEHRLHLSSRSHHYSHCTVLQCRLLLQCVAREGALNKIGFNHLLEIDSNCWLQIFSVILLLSECLHVSYHFCHLSASIYPQCPENSSAWSQSCHNMQGCSDGLPMTNHAHPLPLPVLMPNR